MFVDLDDFKKINDTLGHDVGDALLTQAATRLSACVRNEDTVGRHGGDEFLILIEGVNEPNDMELVAEKILRAFAAPFEINGMTLVVTTSIGVAIFPEDGVDYQALLKSADTAMYEAKSEGKNRFHYYTDKMNQEAQRKLELDRQMHSALENGELSLVYQPIVAADSLSPIGAEVLLRWNSPVLGAISPAEFIPIAEQSGLILSIGEWVLETACQQVKQWIDERGLPFKLSVNVSPRQLRSIDFVDTLSQILSRTYFPASSLYIEVTEGLLIKQTSETTRILEQLEELDVGLSMDDFGTGYSSLSYLKDFPFDNLKIDRSFIRDLPHDHDAQVLITATIAMAHQLGLSVTAEGIEQVDQLQFLRENECDLIQGYLLGKPVPASEFSFDVPLFNDNEVRHA